MDHPPRTPERGGSDDDGIGGGGCSILSCMGVEIISILSPVSICMLLVVLLISTIRPSPSSAPAIHTAASLVYLESPSDSASEKLEGAVLNALAFVALIAAVTFLLVLLYYLNFTSFLRHYMRFSAFFVFSSMGGSILLSLLRRFSLPLDALTSSLLLLNFTAAGVLSVFSPGFPILLRQAYMVSLGVIVAAWFTDLPEWTTWTLLLALAAYDLVAVLSPAGPLKLLVDLASSREEDLPALIYEARPTLSPSPLPLSTSSLFVGAAIASGDSVFLELQPLSSPNPPPDHATIQIQNQADHNDNSSEEPSATTLLLPSPSRSGNNEPRQQPERPRDSGYSVGREPGGVGFVDEEMSPLVAVVNLEHERGRPGRGGDDESEALMTRGIRLGLGDFVFYSVLLGRAAMYDLMTMYACYLAIISGLGCTLILLSVCHHALPALPISIVLGFIFYFLTRLLMEPFVVGASMNLVMF